MGAVPRGRPPSLCLSPLGAAFTVVRSVVVPVRVVVPGLGALGRLLQRPCGLLGRGVGAEPVGVPAPGALLDGVVLETVPPLVVFGHAVIVPRSGASLLTRSRAGVRRGATS